MINICKNNKDKPDRMLFAAACIVLPILSAGVSIRFDIQNLFTKQGFVACINTIIVSLSLVLFYRFYFRKRVINRNINQESDSIFVAKEIEHEIGGIINEFKHINFELLSISIASMYLGQKQNNLNDLEKAHLEFSIALFQSCVPTIISLLEYYQNNPNELIYKIKHAKYTTIKGSNISLLEGGMIVQLSFFQFLSELLIKELKVSPVGIEHQKVYIKHFFEEDRAEMSNQGYEIVQDLILQTLFKYDIENNYAR